MSTVLAQGAQDLAHMRELRQRTGRASGTRPGCEECRELVTHAFRGPDDLLHALQLAAMETDRGVLKRLDARELTNIEREALDSALDASAAPDAIRLRFQCLLCGSGFELVGNMEDGSGSWTREIPPVAPAPS